MTSDCVEVAASLISKMNTDVNPCENFYEYACGGWKEKSVIPDEEAGLFIFTQLSDRLNVMCKGIIEEDILETDIEAVVKAKQFYRSCMDEALIDSISVQQITQLIHTLGGWPVMEDGAFDEDSWNLTEILIKMRLIIDKNYIFSQAVGEDFANSILNIIYIDQPELGIESAEYYKTNITNKITAAYIDFMTSMATTLRLDHDRKKAYESMLDAFRFEQQLAEISEDKAARRNIMDLYNKKTISELKEMSPYIEWVPYFNGIFEETELNLDEEMEPLIVCSIPYVKKIGGLLQQTPKRVVANYLIARFIKDFSLHLGKNEREFRQKYLRVTRGEEKEPSRWRFCIDKTNRFIGGALGYPFIKKYFDEESKRVADEMIGDIKDSLEELIHKTDWMDDYTRTNAIKKAKSIRQMVGYDPYMVDVDHINQQYERINIDSAKYFENVIGAYTENSWQNMIKLRKPVDKYKWPGSTVIVVNAFYHHASNFITFPAGILQSPFYSTKSTQSMNYGGIGVVIGHELTHGYDDKGRLFNQDGNLQAWWSNSSIDAYLKKSECFVDQYNNYTVKEVNKNVDGRQTLGENMADNGGLKEAYMAYRNWVKRNGQEEDLLPGLNMTHDQIFFLNFGQIWCSKAKREEIIHQLSVEEHSYADFRVIGSVSNSEAFSKAYNCKLGSPMNPKKKCTVW
ncbi:neprilysin-1-like [Antedon mediterranea]|uniref:neprilysin-1-like n=1 Tax=Antedon mediterranea TaxID=105859 RepID=UPI003AF9B9CB